MMIFDTIRDFIKSLNRQEMIRYASFYVGLCVVGMIIILVRHMMISKDLYQKTVILNKSRSTAQQIFTKFQVVQQQKNSVDELLKKNKNFNIQKFFPEIVAQHNLTTEVSSRFAREKLPNGYIQESLTVTCTGITTQDLCELITSIEAQPLMYITFVDITNMLQTKKINVSMTIATLQAEA
jgi:hypothetical protein